MREKLFKFLKPEKNKVLLAILIPYIWNILLTTLNYIQHGTTYPLAFLFISLYSTVIQIFLYLVESMIMYPFACSVILLFRYYKIGKIKELLDEKLILSLVIISFLIFNPLILNAITSLYTISTSITNIPRGVEIIEVVPSSPAEKMGLKSNEIIIGIGYYWYIKEGESIGNYKRIENLRDISDIMNQIRPGGEIKIQKINNVTKPKVDSMSYHLPENVTPVILGVKIRDAEGNEAIL